MVNPPIGQRKTRRSLGERLLSGSVWMAGSRGIQALCGLLLSMLLARMLSPGEMGVYFVLASIALLGSTLAQFGTHQAIVKLIAGGLALKDEAGVVRSIRSIVIVAVIGSAVVAGGYWVGAGELLAKHVFQSQGVALTVGVTAVWIVLRSAQMLISKAFRGFQNLKLAAVYEGAQTQLLNVVALAFLMIFVGHATLTQAVGATLIALAITVLTGVWLIWKYHWSKLPAVSGVALGKTVRLSAPLFVSSFSLLAVGEMHLWLLGGMSTVEQVAIYGAGFRLMKLVQLPLTLINHVIPPSVAELFAQGEKDKLERLMRLPYQHVYYLCSCSFFQKMYSALFTVIFFDPGLWCFPFWQLVKL